MSGYQVTQIPLNAVSGVHNGTGTWHDSLWVVVPGSVPPPGLLAFTGEPLQVTTMLFAIPDNVVPNWFGVAVPAGITEFGNAHIFFHPTPAQAGYSDGDYPAKTGKWPELFYYMERLGYQLNGAARNQVLIMPFLTEGAKNTGILPGHWQQITADILTSVRDTVTGEAGPPIEAGSVAVSSFSAGIIYSDSFRRLATGLSPVLAEVWDLDGNFSTYRAISQALRTSAGCRVIQYDQIPSNDLTSFHVPLPRWAGYVAPPTTAAGVHALIRDYMFLHGATISDVGDAIQIPQPAVPPAPVPVTPVPQVPVTPVPQMPVTPVPQVPVTPVPQMPVTPVPVSPVPTVPILPVAPKPPVPAVVVPPRPPPPTCPPAWPGVPAPRPHAGACGAPAALTAEVGAVALTAIQAVAAIAARRAARAGCRTCPPEAGIGRETTRHPNPTSRIEV
jgi:hypothetical protein